MLLFPHLFLFSSFPIRKYVNIAREVEQLTVAYCLTAIIHWAHDFESMRKSYAINSPPFFKRRTSEPPPVGIRTQPVHYYT